MVVPTARRIVALTALVTALTLATTTNAAPMFTVTDLGSKYTLQQDSSGTVHSVTSGDGSHTLAFEKSPTKSIDVKYDSYGVLDHLPTLGQWYYQDIHGGGYIQGTLQNGSLIQGYFADEISGTGFTPHVPLGFYGGGDWHNELMSPVADMNAHGEIVGTSLIANRSYFSSSTYAAFSTATGETHDFAKSFVADNLNNYIASSLGINLTQGLKVDDLGRIIAQGTTDGKGQYFLLTPNGSPTPAPEPSTLALLVVGITALGVRAAHRRRERLHSTAA